MLGLIDPTLARVYWDFMIDHQYGDRWYKDSPLYREDWFGTLDNAADDGFRVRGRFRGVLNYAANASEEAWTDVNPYGFVSSPYSVESATHLQRSNAFCGLANTQPFASCGRMTSCFENVTSSGLLDFDLCLENHIHANLHGLHGGYWGCAADLSAFRDNHTGWATDSLLSFLVANIAEEVVTKASSLFPYISCPSSCTLGVDDFATCHCNSSVPEVDTLDDDDVYNYLGLALAKLHEGYLGAHFMDKNRTTGEHIFKGLQTHEDRLLKRLYLRLLREPGSFGVFATGAAPNDPIFWPMHPIFDKMTQVLRLSPAYSRAMNFSWDNGGTSCTSGVGWDDVLPFEDLFAASRQTANASNSTAWLSSGVKLDGAYTNADLWELFTPDGDAIPYVYDQFTGWGECEWDPLATVPSNASASATNATRRR